MVSRSVAVPRISAACAAISRSTSTSVLIEKREYPPVRRLPGWMRSVASQLQHADGVLLRYEVQDAGTVAVAVLALVAQEADPDSLRQLDEFDENR